MSTVSVTNDAATLIVTSKKHGEFRVQIDKEDAERVAAHTWAVQNRQTRSEYFITHPQEDDGSWGSISLHKFIMGGPAGFNNTRNTLDCRKSNLRLLSETVKPAAVTTTPAPQQTDNKAYAARLYEAAARAYEAAARAYEAA